MNKKIAGNVAMTLGHLQKIVAGLKGKKGKGSVKDLAYALNSSSQGVQISAGRIFDIKNGKGKFPNTEEIDQIVNFARRHIQSDFNIYSVPAETFVYRDKVWWGYFTEPSAEDVLIGDVVDTEGGLLLGIWKMFYWASLTQDGHTTYELRSFALILQSDPDSNRRLACTVASSSSVYAGSFIQCEGHFYIMINEKTKRESAFMLGFAPVRAHPYLSGLAQFLDRRIPERWLSLRPAAASFCFGERWVPKIRTSSQTHEAEVYVNEINRTITNGGFVPAIHWENFRDLYCGKASERDIKRQHSELYKYVLTHKVNGEGPWTNKPTLHLSWWQ